MSGDGWSTVGSEGSDGIEIVNEMLVSHVMTFSFSTGFEGILPAVGIARRARQ